ncbi:MAG TPA: fibronectin type III domain-containing protein, partial [Chthoniobacteraceae bacterium]|nr:fibronectin type III domain-containing protein [Chthoniobacteraceae bacterium]
LGILQNSTDKIAAEIISLTGPVGVPPTPPAGKIGILNAARQRHTAALTVLRETVAASRVLAMQAIDVLRPTLGRQWTSRWMAAGFSSGSIAVPRDPYLMLIDLREYFRRNADREVEVLGVTAVALDAQVVAIEAARREVDSARSAASAALAARNEAQRLLQRRLSALRYELGLLLSNDDARWYEFGFRRPIDGRIPEQVEEVTATPHLPGEIVVRWNPARRAENYTVIQQVIGVDPEPLLVKRVADTETILRDLPRGATVKLAVAARNATGDSLPVEVEVFVT